MKRTFRRPGFARGVLVALLLSVLASALHTAGLFFPPFGSARMIAALVVLIYLLYLLRAAGLRIGRLVTLAGWLLGTTAVWLWSPGIIGFIALQVLMVWLVRSLCFHRSFLTALLDLALSTVAFALGLWAGLRTGSLFLGCWCFWLVQAAFVFIPGKLNGARSAGAPLHTSELFDRAHRRAENAFRRLSRERP